ncbi:MAG: hypothetical protein O2968_23870, partial [Acidobacteria bacterium]|nr:hypothetical protein [Acidobacteriota bacterium]
SKDLETTYVFPIAYQNYDCNQLAAELQRVTRRAGELKVSIDKDAANDAAQMGVGLVLFWPALFFLEGGDGPQAAEYSRLKGERDALEQVVIQKNCAVSIVDEEASAPAG